MKKTFKTTLICILIVIRIYVINVDANTYDNTYININSNNTYIVGLVADWIGVVALAVALPIGVACCDIIILSLNSSS